MGFWSIGSSLYFGQVSLANVPLLHQMSKATSTYIGLHYPDLYKTFTKV